MNGAKSNSPTTVAGASLALGLGTALSIIGCILPFWNFIFGAAFYLLSIPLTTAATSSCGNPLRMDRLSAFNLIRIMQGGPRIQ
jgi:hypothetical protein